VPCCCSSAPCPGCNPAFNSITLTLKNFDLIEPDQSCIGSYDQFGREVTAPGDSKTNCISRQKALLSTPIQLQYTDSFLLWRPSAGSPVSYGSGYCFWSGANFFTNLGTLPDGSNGCCQGIPGATNFRLEGCGLYVVVRLTCSGTFGLINMFALRPENYPSGTGGLVWAYVDYNVSSASFLLSRWTSYCLTSSSYTAAKRARIENSTTASQLTVAADIEFAPAG